MSFNRKSLGLVVWSMREQAQKMSAIQFKVIQLYLSMTLPLSRPDSSFSYANQGLVFKRHLRIKSSRLPPNFFAQVPSFRYDHVPLISQERKRFSPIRDIQTPCFERRHSVALSNEEAGGERKVETARPALAKLENEEAQLRESFCIRKQSRVHRKLSLGAKLEVGGSSPEKHVRLPKLLNRGILAS